MPKTRIGSGISESQIYQPNAMCGSNLDPDLNKSIIKNILQIMGKIKHREPNAVKELCLYNTNSTWH